MSIIKAEGIILRSMKMGETSKLLTLFTREHGILKVIAKGSRSRKSRFGGTLETLTVIHFVYYHKDSRDLQLLSAADIVETFPTLSSDLEKWGYANACGELIIRAHPAAEATPKLYPILLDSLRAINTAPPGSEARAGFWSLQMKLLSVFGVAPNPRRCLQCETAFNIPARHTVHFHIARGGFFCETCANGAGAPPRGAGSLPLTAEVIVLLGNLQSLPAAKLMQTIISAEAGRSVERFFQTYFHAHLEEIGKLQALEFVREVIGATSARD